MKDEALEQLKYPIGKFQAPEIYSAAYLSAKIEEIASFPERLRVVVTNLIEEQLDTNYRNEGWTVRQVIHHCAESHMNCYIRIKWALTENNPIIKSYDENLWSTLDDNKHMPIQPSLSILDGLHYRLAYIMRNLSITDLEKSFIHPESGATVKVKQIIGTYAWHSNHHLAHITELKRRKNWK